MRGERRKFCIGPAKGEEADFCGFQMLWPCVQEGPFGILKEMRSRMPPAGLKNSMRIGQLLHHIPYWLLLKIH